MRVIGIDPGTRDVGYGIVEGQGSSLTLCESGTISCNGKDKLANRLVEIHHGLLTVMKKWRPEAAVVETVFTGKNPLTAIKIGEGRGVALLSAAEAGAEVVGYAPALVKRALCGNGRAGKRQVQEMVRILLGLPEIPASDHEADALALALCYHNRTRLGLPVTGEKELPPAVREALAGKKLTPRPRGRRKHRPKLR